MSPDSNTVTTKSIILFYLCTSIDESMLSLFQIIKDSTNIMYVFTYDFDPDEMKDYYGSKNANDYYALSRVSPNCHKH